MWNRDIVAAWKRAVEESGSSNPFSRKCLQALSEEGITMVDIRTRLGHILSRKPKERHPDEVELLEFYENLKLEFEQGLVDNCMESAQGSMFLLKTRYNYREGQDPLYVRRYSNIVSFRDGRNTERIIRKLQEDGII